MKKKSTPKIAPAGPEKDKAFTMDMNFRTVRIVERAAFVTWADDGGALRQVCVRVSFVDGVGGPYFTEQQIDNAIAALKTVKEPARKEVMRWIADNSELALAK